MVHYASALTPQPAGAHRSGGIEDQERLTDAHFGQVYIFDWSASTADGQQHWSKIRVSISGSHGNSRLPRHPSPSCAVHRSTTRLSTANVANRNRRGFQIFDPRSAAGRDPALTAGPNEAAARKWVGSNNRRSPLRHT